MPLPHRPSPHPAHELERLVGDVGRLCHGTRAVLQCGREVVAEWSAGGDMPAGPVIATQPFMAGSQTFQLDVHAAVPRKLSPAEQADFRALTETLRETLERHPVVALPPAGQAWVKDHVAAALDYVTESFMLVLDDWTIQHVNTQFEAFTRTRRADIVGRNLWQVFPQMLGTRFEHETRAAMGGSLPHGYEEQSPVSGRWYEVRAFPCQAGLAVLTVDTTERKADAAAREAIEHKLMQAQKMESLGTLASGIAHDFNNLVGAILGHLGLLKEAVQGAQPPAVAESLGQIGVAAERARDLVQQILVHARAGRRDFRFQPLQPSLAESLRLLRSTLPASVRLEVEMASEELYATVGAGEIQQVAMNLCTNASQALGAEGGVVRVELRRIEVAQARPAEVGELRPGPYAVLRVEDTGPGIAPAAAQRLFEPFFTTKARGQGTGLGLYVVSGIVRAHRGAVELATTPGRGSVFCVYFPAGAAASALEAPARGGPRAKANGERVAYVDDDEVVQLMVQRVLERAGFGVAVFSDPLDLLDAVRESPHCFDLLVTDYSMPGRSGLEVAREVRKRCPDIPVIVTTGFASEELKAGVEALGRAVLLQKENTFEELGARAVEVLAAGRPPAA